MTRAAPASARFVGRERQLSALNDLLDEVREGRGQVVGVVGEPGMGKSRLVSEFRRGLAGERLTILEGRCLSYGAAIPWVPVADIVRANCRITDADSPEEVARKVRNGLAEVGIERRARRARWCCTCWACARRPRPSAT